MIQLHQLEGFYRVAIAGGYARAAREFPYPISAPGVHAQVSKLEQSLGMRLFVQVAKDRTLPTPAGAQLLEYCRPFFERLPRLVEDLRGAQGSTRVRVHAGALEIHEVLPAWIRRVRARHPLIEIELEEIVKADHGSLLRGEADLIVEYQPHVPKGVLTRHVATHHAFFVVPARHRRARGRRPRLEEFLTEPFVALDAQQPQQALQLQALRALGARPRRIVNVPSVTSILAFVAAGLGYSLVPWPSASGPRRAGVTAVRLRSEGTSFPVVASYSARRKGDTAIEAVLRLARGRA